MRTFRVWQYRVSRLLGRLAVRIAAVVTRERMPPFVSTSAVVADGDRVLVVIDPIRAEPVLPGGHLTWRENPEHAVIREVREETGYDIRPSGLIGVFTGEEWSGEPGVVRLIYQASLTGGSLRSSAEGEARWVPIQTLASSSTRDAPIVQVWLDQQRSSAHP